MRRREEGAGLTAERRVKRMVASGGVGAREQSEAV